MGSEEGHPRVLIRADADPRIGSGHVIRCLALAGHLRARDAKVYFALRRPSRIISERIVAAGHEVVPLEHDLPDGVARAQPWPEQVQDRDVAALLDAVDGGFDAVVVDHYRLDARWETRVRTCADRVVAVDDLADRTRDVDVLVDQNWYGPETASRHVGRVPSDALLLLGPRYALLQAEYARVRHGREPVTHPPRRLLVSFGGADVTGETSRVLVALSDGPELASIRVDVVLGSRELVTPQVEEQVRTRPGTRLHVELPTLAHLLAEVDLAIGASGAATWERICLGVPAIVATSGPSQSGVTRALDEAGMTTWAGVGGNLTVGDHRRLLRRAMAQPLPVAPPLVDGFGAARVAEAVLPSADPSVTVRQATPLDLPTHIGDDPASGTRKRHALLGPALWAEEEAGFARDMVDSAAARGVVELDGLSVGRVLARRRGGAVEVTYSLDDLVAHRHLGPALHHILRHANWDAGSGGLGFRAGVGHAATAMRGNAAASGQLDVEGFLEVPLVNAGTD